MSYAIQNAGSPALGLDGARVDAVVAEEFGRWAQATCAEGQAPAFSAQSRGQVLCDQVEYNCAQDNVNVVMFRDQGWPYAGSDIALTTLTMNTNTGEILDSDVEVNTAEYAFRLDEAGEPEAMDLRMVLAHELGHFLGLSHSNDASALMQDGGKLTPDLTSDDVFGVCAIYPPGNDALACPIPSSAEGASCHGEQHECPQAEEEPSGCACSLPRARGPWNAWPLVLLAFGICRRTQRRSRKHHPERGPVAIR